MMYPDQIDDICELLNNDGVVICPTDTIWGLSCNAMSAKAVQRVFDIKNRKIGNPFILLVSDIEMLKRYVSFIHPRIETLLSFHDKPLTIIYHHTQNLPDYTLADNKSIGIRIVKDDYCKEIIRKLDSPIISTSANYSQQSAPKFYQDIDTMLLKEVDFVSQYKRNSQILFKPSVIIQFNAKGEIEVLRP